MDLSRLSLQPPASCTKRAIYVASDPVLCNPPFLVMPRLPDFHAPASTYLGSWCWHPVPSLGTQLEGGTADKLVKDSGDEKRLKKSVRAAKQKAVKRPRYNTTALLP